MAVLIGVLVLLISGVFAVQSFSPGKQDAGKSFTLPQADVKVRALRDGSVRVTERITYDLSGPFTGGFRDVPLRKGESIADISVSEAGRRYRPGASAELGSSGAPGTYGADITDDRARIVWHYSALNQQRTFAISYRLRGLAVAYDDVVDVNVQVWGDEWKVSLERLTATEVLPDPRAPVNSFQAFGSPQHVRDEVARAPGRAELRAFDVPAEQSVELRVLFPRSMLTSTAAAKVEKGNREG